MVWLRNSISPYATGDDMGRPSTAAGGAPRSWRSAVVDVGGTSATLLMTRSRGELSVLLGNNSHSGSVSEQERDKNAGPGLDVREPLGLPMWNNCVLEVCPTGGARDVEIGGSSVSVSGKRSYMQMRRLFDEERQHRD
eukprot:CAMPEP_0115549962 /NCGR_PEP_ID=MMETSP0271-20121206/94972_1 /TAXON_ID=71861 /ORGANISM="Scrippsiella trochoidea, Strain CCMP3099" /LENGTH=137 /DNA_ID=CAMNT_0002983521 /DNA_START=125 /DNA_END=538 /DNA_ORIENTATION=+